MVRFSQDRILLIADIHCEVEPVLAQAVPSAQVTRVENVFDAIAELAGHQGEYGAVVANAEPIERRPEAAVRTLRELAGSSRIILFAHPTLEPVSRKMLEFGCDDYVISPPTPAELGQIFGRPLMRLADKPEPVAEQPAGPLERTGEPSTESAVPSMLHTVPLADLLLDALVQHPGAAYLAAIEAINAAIGPAFGLHYQRSDKKPPLIDDSYYVMTAPVRVGTDVVAQLHLGIADKRDELAARHFLAAAATAFGKLATLQDRHNRLFALGITDQLTGIYNRRYFEHFLAKILEKAKVKRLQVTLLLFDIDNFKRYNDECGHTIGDDILKETAALMKRCCREHDLVARIGGDEFAVVFWEKEPPRQPKDPQLPVTPGRVPQEPLQILGRFRQAISTREFSGLGVNGRGILTISGGLASYPWDGRTVGELVEAADRALTFGAKKGGKNSIYLVGGDEQRWDDAPAAKSE